MPMSGKENGVVGSIVGKIGKWIEAYEAVRREEEELKERLQRVNLFLEDAKGYLIDTEKMQREKKTIEEELQKIREKRLKLEWLATSKIKKREWNPEVLREYEFIRDLLLLSRIREEQVKEVCRNCNECSLIRVKTTSKEDLPLEAVVGTTRGLPYLPLYSLMEIRDNRLKEIEVKETPLGALTSEERKEIEKRVREKLALSKSVLNCFLKERKVPLNEEVVLKHRKYGCHRKLPKWLPITIMNTEIDSDPKAPDHFPEDITASLGEDGSYDHIYLSSKHGSEESE
jgi:hypothetical protein